jgi:NADH-quinone oxidoreductase subunit G
MDTVTLTIDGRQLTVEKGKTVLQAALENGIHVPYYCYHPGIGVDGSCRVCIVKIEKMPKLQTSCSTHCADGMVVHTQAPDVVEARAGVLEFLLLNHPLDCPVCDKGGECPLQDFAYTFGPERSRMEFPRRVFDGEGAKADVDFGPTLMLNRNRCILCTRCVRFMREIEGDAQINIIDRGYGSEIATFQEEGVHSLISGNLMDVCPVGAITTKDYRFKSRPWDNPQAADTICTLCSKGCNTTAWLKGKPEWAKGARLIRITPRFTPAVNGYWMCDIGRFGYHWIESEDRLRQPLVRDGQHLKAVPWTDALAALGERRGAQGAIHLLASAHASHEGLYLLEKIANHLGTPLGLTWRATVKEQPADTTFRVPAVDAPNVGGARLQGLLDEAVADPTGVPDTRKLAVALEAGEVAALYVFDPGPDGTLGDVSWIIDTRRSGRLPLLVVQGVLMTDLARAADIVLPGASFMEEDASYTNDQGRLQGATRVLAPPGDARENWQVLVDVGRVLGLDVERYSSQESVRGAIADTFSGVESLAELRSLTFGSRMPAKTWLQGSNPSERWKWDFMVQDLPPVKGAVEPSALPPEPVAVIPLKPVK